MTYLHAYLAAFALFWCIFAISVVRWQLLRRRTRVQAVRRLVIG